MFAVPPKPPEKGGGSKCTKWNERILKLWEVRENLNIQNMDFPKLPVQGSSTPGRDRAPSETEKNPSFLSLTLKRPLMLPCIWWWIHSQAWAASVIAFDRWGSGLACGPANSWAFLFETDQLALMSLLATWGMHPAAVSAGRSLQNKGRGRRIWCLYSWNPKRGWFSLWLFNIAMENGPFIDGLPIKNCDFPWLC